jgi:hypothetical protein
MATLPPQPVQITCPNCRTTFQTPVFQLIDVDQQPELKQALLSGQINVAVCPNCRTSGLLATPLLYHDSSKQIFWSLFPQELNAKPDEQEKFIGALQQFVMQGLPADTPKGYLLNPRRFISLTTMLDALLETEGISKGALEAQRRRTALLAQLLQTEDESAFEQLVTERKAEIDYEFLITLAAYIEAAEMDGDGESVARFTELRDRLVELTGIGDPEGAGDAGDLDAAITALLDADEAKLRETIAEHRPALDYDFYAALTERADAARTEGNGGEAERIETRRNLILETAEQMDREAQELFERAANTLREVLVAEDLKEALDERRADVNEAFMLVVATNREAAERQGQTEIAERFAEIEELAVQVIQEAMSPEERFISELLGAETPQASTKLLRQNAAKITPALVKRINELADEMESNNRTEVGERLRQLGRESASMLF